MDALELKQARVVILVGMLLNVVLSGVKLMAGIFANSAALVADGVHSLSDLVTDIVALVGIRIGSIPTDENHAYGHGKFETLAAAIIGVLLLVAGFGIGWAGLQQIHAYIQGQAIMKPGTLALLVAFISIVCKEGLYQYTLRAGRRLESTALVANAWHHRSDAFSSLGTLAGISGAIFLGEKWRVLDPVAALIIALFVLKVAVDIMRSSVDELVEKSLGKEVEGRIVAMINGIDGADNPHRLRTRRIGNRVAVDMHIHVDPSHNIVEAHAISTRIEDALKDELGNNAIINVHVEPRHE